MEKYKALILGCGNIGALYDFENDKVQTHAKALYLNMEYDVDVFDCNIELAKKVAEKYSFLVIANEIDIDFTQYQLISICTPTFTHFNFLKKCFEAQVPVVICEKPVDLNLNNLSELKELYFNSNTKVLVNYIRRFQPKFSELKEVIKKNLNEDKLQTISINYQRGFFNNCSHAFDTLEFLLNQQLELSNISLLRNKFDAFQDDPTMTMHAEWNHVNFLINGIEDINYPVFEIYLYFQYVCISILKSGNHIQIAYSTKSNHTDYIFENVIENYMLPVVEYVNQYTIKNNLIPDNFIRSIELVERMKSWINNK